MREIKFRAWVKANNSQQKYAGMYPVYCLAPDGVTVIRSSVFAPNMFPIEDIELMQYTGLKLNKELYDGDIVQVLEQWINKHNNKDIHEENTYNLQCTFVNYEWELIKFHKNDNGIIMPTQPIIKLSDYRIGYSWGDGLEIWGHNNFDYKQRFTNFKIIGNAWENPELIKG